MRAPLAAVPEPRRTQGGDLVDGIWLSFRPASATRFLETTCGVQAQSWDILGQWKFRWRSSAGVRKIGHESEGGVAHNFAKNWPRIRTNVGAIATGADANFQVSSRVVQARLSWFWTLPVGSAAPDVAGGVRAHPNPIL